MTLTCNKCPLHKTRTKIVWGTPRPSRPCSVLLIGEAPGEEEDFTGLPFVGGAGRTLWKAILNSNLGKHFKPEIAITNIIKCRPPNNRDPSYEEVAACRPWLATEILEYQPRVIVLLGAISLKSFTGETKITPNYNSIHTQNFADFGHRCLVVPTFHPAYINHGQPQYLLALINTFNRVADLIPSAARWRRTAVRYTYDPPPYRLSELLTLHGNGDPHGFAFDLETTGLDPWNDKLIGLSFSGIENEAVAITLNRKDPYNDPKFKIIYPTLADENVPKTIQNASFDVYWLKVQKHSVSGFEWDTKLAAGMLYSDLPRDLSWLRAWYTDVLPYKELAKKRGIWNLTLKELTHYACQDADVTWRARLKQQQDMQGTELENCYRTITKPLTEALISICHRGVLVDQVALTERMINLGPRVEEIVNKFLTYGTEISSPKQVSELLVDRGFYLPRTAKGNLTTKAEVIEDLIKQVRSPEQRILLNDILEYRGLAKTTQTYLIGLNQLIKQDGRVHTVFDSSGTATSRISSSGPNLQNQPPNVRDLFLVDPGYYLLDADYSMLELVVAAVQADETVMLDHVAAGHYVHGETCAMLFNIKEEDATKHQLDISKQVTFGTMYGRSPHSIAKQFNVPVDVAKAWQEKIMYAYPMLVIWRDENVRKWQQDGYLTSVFGRVRHCNSVTEALNVQVQSAAGDVTNTSLTRLEDGVVNTDIQPLLAVHDEILVQVPNQTTVKDACMYLRSIMCRPIPQLNNQKFQIHIKYGMNWGEMEEVK